ncbi:MAG: galactokinase [bacterium]|nr:galactokinase [bacterium]
MYKFNIKNIKNTYQEFFKKDSQDLLTVSAPGRINLIGEHTDYNGGFVLPIAIDRNIYMAGTKRNDGIIRVYSIDYEQNVQFNIDSIRFNKEKMWVNYIGGVLKSLLEIKADTNGADIVFGGDIPEGAGLSSSAALEVATVYFFNTLFNMHIPHIEMIKLCQRAENQFVGVNCGIMDQFVSMLGKKDHALFLDCKNLSYKNIPLKLEEFNVVVCNTNLKRELASSEYNKRRATCERAVSSLKRFLPQIEILRDVSIEEFEKYKGSLDEIAQKRCKHVLYENRRVLDAINALGRNDILEFGKLMNESHESLKSDYEVSCLELDTMVNIARSINGVIGARMTGGGFGGCTVNIVKKDVIDKFSRVVSKEYQKKTGIKPNIYICSPENSAKKIS